MSFEDLFDLTKTVTVGIPTLALPLFALSLLVAALGFFRVVWFISIGYGGSVAAMAVLIAVVGGGSLNTWAAVHAAVIAAYGIRLSIYLIRRDLHSSYSGVAAEIREANASVPLWLRILIWPTVSLLYVVMVSPVVYHAAAAVANGMSQDAAGLRAIVTAVGLFVGVAGLLTEAAADAQKSRFKSLNAGRLCTIGLYRIVRFPNYFGEILVWTGSWIAGIPYYTRWPHWVIATVGLVVIVLIMLGSAKRLEERQDARYGELHEYKEYVRTTRALFPLVPLYSLKRLKIYLG